MPSYGETLYAAMMRAQMDQAAQGWQQAERDKEIGMQRDDQSFDQMARVFDMLQRAQEGEHKRKMETAKAMGATGQQLPSGLAGKPAYEQTARASKGMYDAEKAAKALAAKQAMEKYLGGMKYQSDLTGERQAMQSDRDAQELRAQKRWEAEQAFKKGMIPAWMKEPYSKKPRGSDVGPNPVRRTKEVANLIRQSGQDIEQERRNNYEFDTAPTKYNAAAAEALRVGREIERRIRDTKSPRERARLEALLESEIRRITGSVGLSPDGVPIQSSGGSSLKERAREDLRRRMSGGQ